MIGQPSPYSDKGSAEREAACLRAELHRTVREWSKAVGERDENGRSLATLAGILEALAERLTPEEAAAVAREMAKATGLEWLSSPRLGLGLGCWVSSGRRLEVGMVAEDICGSRRLAELTGKSQRTAQRWLKAGLLPALPAPPGTHRKVSLQALRERLLEIARWREAEE